MEIFSGVFFSAISLFVLYLVIRVAVRDGINSSEFGRLRQRRNQEAGKSSFDKFVEDDLDK